MFGGGSASAGPSTTTSSLPRPHFWTLLRLVTHRVGLKTINELDQITTDVGRCRAWIRFAINDETLTSSIGNNALSKEWPQSVSCYTKDNYRQLWERESGRIE